MWPHVACGSQWPLIWHTGAPEDVCEVAPGVTIVMVDPWAVFVPYLVQIRAAVRLWHLGPPGATDMAYWGPWFSPLCDYCHGRLLNSVHAKFDADWSNGVPLAPRGPWGPLIWSTGAPDVACEVAPGVTIVMVDP